MRPRGDFLGDYSVYSYSGIGITEQYRISIPKRTDFVLFWKQNRAIVTKNEGDETEEFLVRHFLAKRRAKIAKRTRLYSILTIYSVYSAIGSRTDGIPFHSFRNHNRSQKNTITTNSVYSHSGIVPKAERALCVSSCFEEHLAVVTKLQHRASEIWHASVRTSDTRKDYAPRQRVQENRVSMVQVFAVPASEVEFLW